MPLRRFAEPSSRCRRCSVGLQFVNDFGRRSARRLGTLLIVSRHVANRLREKTPLARRSKEEIRKEFDRLGLFLETFVQVLVEWKEFHPSALEDIKESFDTAQRRGGAVALRGAEMAVNDFVSMSRDLSSQQIKAMDERLVSVGAPKLSGLLRESSTRVSSILKRNQVRSEIEYYLLKEEVVDLESSLTAAQREQAERMLNDFEEKVATA